jgi:hypothetical protein
MKDLRTLLESADPVRNEPPLPDDDVQRMRRAVIAASEDSRAIPSLRWTQWTAAALTVGVIATVGITYVERSQNDRTATVDDGPTVEPPVTTPRQLQFVTAGGTRIIWVFNPEFEITGSTR